MAYHWINSIILIVIYGILCVEMKNLANLKNNHTQTNIISQMLKHAGIEITSDEMKLMPGSDCARICYEFDLPLICHFQFYLENYHTMGPACKNCSKGVTKDCFAENCITADGYERGVLSINRQIPGPSIQVCKNDVIIVDTLNEMAGIGETLHWHGILQHGTPWMDGVPMVTQCPILPSNMFRYAFVARESGTKFYHSHSGHNKVNGIYGPLIIREPDESDPNSVHYECDLEEHTIMLSDWLHSPADMYMPGLKSKGNTPDSVLINGRGIYRNTVTNATTNVPLSIFRINECKSYRFRLVNACNGVCQMQLQIENHPMTIIASDSGKVRPTTINTLYTLAGERYDFIVHANQQRRDYWIRMKAVGLCGDRVPEQFAVLSYLDPTDVTDYELSMPTRKFPSLREPYPLGIHLNKPNIVGGQRKNYCISDLIDVGSTTASKVDLITSPPDYQFILPFNNYPVPDAQVYSKEFYHHFLNLGQSTIIGAVKNITFTFPPFPPLTQSDYITEYSDDNTRDQTWCDENNLPARCAGYVECPCAHRLVVEKNKIVELILVDDTKESFSLTHPFHLHGHDFHVLDVGLSPTGQSLSLESVTEIVQNGKFHEIFGQQRKIGRTVLHAPSKDTVQVPSSGVVRLRFNSTNPGFWFMHCHIDWHQSIGMAFVIQVGDVDEMAPTPDNFPTCYDFAPDINLEKR